MSDISHQISDIRYVFDSSLFRLSDIREASPFQGKGLEGVADV